jgi:chromosome segregation ATPase
VKRETDVSAVSIPQNQTNPEKQYSINEETNLQNPETSKQSVLEKLKSWIYEHKTATGVIAVVALVSIVAVIGVCLHMKNSNAQIEQLKQELNKAKEDVEGARSQVNQLTDENTQLKINNAEHPAPAAESVVDTNQLKIQIEELSAENEQLKTDNEQIEPLKQERDKAKEDAEGAQSQVNQLTEENKQLKTDNAQIEQLKQDLDKAKEDVNLQATKSEQAINDANLQISQLAGENKQLKKDNEKQVVEMNQQKLLLENAQGEVTIVKQEITKLKNEITVQRKKAAVSKINKLLSIIANKAQLQNSGIAEKADVETETDAGITYKFLMGVNEQVFTNAMQTIQQELAELGNKLADRQSLLEQRVLVLQNKLSEPTPQ